MKPDTSTPARRRSVRSFVRRAGRLTVSQQRALDELWPEFGVEFRGETLVFGALFGRAAPVVLEIGFGNGETLVQQAAGHPECDFLGIEVHEPAVGVLDTMIPPASLARLNLYFPDPWPKKRHHKRRIVQPAFLDLVADRLAPAGSLNVATDWENYAGDIEAKVLESGRFHCAERRVHGGDEPLDRPKTKFERRGLRHGHRIWDWRFVRAHDASERLATREL